MAAHRMERVNEVMLRELATLIPKTVMVQGTLMTVTGVQVSPDLKNADVYLSFLGGNNELHESILAQVSKARAEIQHLVSRRVQIKFTPHLHFKLDRSAEHGTKLVQLIDNLAIPNEESESR